MMAVKVQIREMFDWINEEPSRLLHSHASTFEAVLGLKVLDLFCGRGGWSKPFIEDGDEVWGIDIKDYHYPGHLIKEDIHNLDGYSFSDCDLIIGSPPCNEFSVARNWHSKTPRDIKGGLELISQFHRFVKEAQPRLWAFENVRELEKYYAPKPVWHFWMSKGGKRSLWGNLQLPLVNEYRFPNKVMGCTRETRRRHNVTHRLPTAARAEIPYPIARFIADSVKGVAR